MGEHTLKSLGTPGAPPSRRPPSPLLKNLVKVANEHPGEEVEVAQYSTADSARIAVAMLVSGKRAKRRPTGTWEFRHGVSVEDPKKFGVRAIFTPPAQ